MLAYFIKGERGDFVWTGAHAVLDVDRQVLRDFLSENSFEDWIGDRTESIPGKLGTIVAIRDDAKGSTAIQNENLWLEVLDRYGFGEPYLEHNYAGVLISSPDFEMRREGQALFLSVSGFMGLIRVDQSTAGYVASWSDGVHGRPRILINSKHLSAHSGGDAEAQDRALAGVAIAAVGKKVLNLFGKPATAVRDRALSTERKRRQRQRQLAAGLVEIKVKVPVDRVPHIRQLAAEMCQPSPGSSTEKSE